MAEKKTVPLSYIRLRLAFSAASLQLLISLRANLQQLTSYASHSLLSIFAEKFNGNGFASECIIKRIAIFFIAICHLSLSKTNNHAILIIILNIL